MTTIFDGPLSGIVEVRAKNHGDEAFIFESWLNGLYYANKFFKDIPRDIYLINYHRVLEKIIDAPNTVIEIVTLKEAPTAIIAYVVYQTTQKGPVLHWVFVKPIWRNQGIATAIVPENTVYCTHLTAVGRSLKPKQMEFNPFAISIQ